MGISGFKEFCEAFRELAMSPKSAEELVIEGQLILSELLAKPDFLLENLAALTENKQDEDHMPIDLNEITIFRDPGKWFSLRLYVWEPNYPYPIHDHGSWGLIGCLNNMVRETKYLRMDDGTEEDYAELEVRAESILQPGHTSFVLPLNDGIHRMLAFGEKTALTVHVYGKPQRTGFIQGFVHEYNVAYKLYPLKLHRRILAVKALEAISTDWAQEILKITSRDDDEVIRKTSLAAIEKIKLHSTKGG